MLKVINFKKGFYIQKGVKKPKPDCLNNLVLKLCPEQDSNLHTVTGTTPSK